MRVYSKDSERLSVTLKNKDAQNMSRPSMLDGTESLKKFTAEKDALVIQTNEYIVSKKDLDRNLSEQ